MRVSGLTLSTTVLFLLLLALATTPARADWIVLKNGRIWRGTVDPPRNGKIRIRFDGGTVDVLEDDVQRVEPEMSYADRLQTGARRLAADDVEGAGISYRIALELRPNEPRAEAGYCRVLMRGDDRAKRRAVNRAHLLAVQNKRDPHMFLLYGEALTANGEYDKAARELGRAERLAPGDESVSSAVRRLLRANTEAKRRAANGGGPPTAGLEPGSVPAPDPATENPRAGNNADARRASVELLAWAREPDDQHRNAFLSSRLDLVPEPVRASTTGERLTRYRRSVTRVTYTVTVDHTAWLRIRSDVPVRGNGVRNAANRRERKVTLAGWVYQLRARYPRADISVLAVRRREGSARPVPVGRGRWDKTYRRVTFEHLGSE